MHFYLQDVGPGYSLTSPHTIDIVRIEVVAAIKPEAPPAPDMPPDGFHAGFSETAVQTSIADSRFTTIPSSRAGHRGHGPGRAVILLYHRVADLKSDPWGLAVTPARFAEQLRVLRKHGPILSLAALGVGLRDGCLPDRCVAITFDDGYADNLHVAKPLLQRYDVPATVFVTTGALVSKREFWWDELARVILEPGWLPRNLSLTIDGVARAWDLGDDAVYGVEAQRRHRRWKAWEGPAPTARHLLYRSLYELLYPLREQERRQIQDDLLAWAGASLDPAAKNHQTLSPEELLDLARGELVDIGAHTVTHSLLAAASPAVQRREIQQSKNELEQILGTPVVSFAYPFGKIGDYTDETVGIIQESQFTAACSNFAGTVRRGVDRFQLPRMYMGNWDAVDLSKQLSVWFGG
jgi:peptidoglycan/xylan/chitin deacetylase (PgdA/CDA1 family)